MSKNTMAHGAAAWRGYRVWARLRWVAFLGWMPFGITVSWLDGDGAVATVLIGAWFLFGMVTLGATGFFACPRCGEQFFWSWTRRNPFTRSCLHCGLPKWAEP